MIESQTILYLWLGIRVDLVLGSKYDKDWDLCLFGCVPVLLVNVEEIVEMDRKYYIHNVFILQKNAYLSLYYWYSIPNHYIFSYVVITTIIPVKYDSLIDNILHRIVVLDHHHNGDRIYFPSFSLPPAVLPSWYCY